MWGKSKEIEEKVECSLVKAPKVYIEPTPRQKIQILMDAYPSQEWLCYLKGRQTDTSIFVEDIFVPPHEDASSGSALAEPFHIPEDCVGILHSHHGMGAFHSATDRDYVDKNFPVSITVAKSRTDKSIAYDAVSYVQTPCGKNVILECKVLYVQPELLFNKEEFLTGAKAEIEKGKKTYLYQTAAIGSKIKGRGGRAFKRSIPEGTQVFRGNYGVTKDGVVLSQQELDDMYDEIWQDKQMGGVWIDGVWCRD